ncbi:putative xyloglucan endotransglucosylase/hydrolase protein 26 [Hibiscus syriacus]|uniref:RING-type E3 ubiquitin transferase n=1 Tax=Hibiscus syriacus TaxID=106335 RepID=A0A6A3B8A7_HIBSY|nr:E3 ubiquitin-protein ligase ATL42-like [Hibiscus syriacus]KAE8712561.1 putative xyloglucan endotransglucosylase/hydrolase protein 26 [Hibiscus syriacus]
MNRLLVSISIVLSLPILAVDAQSPDLTSSGDAVSNFRPSLAVVIGILCVMFALTVFLLIYARLCNRGASAVQGDHHPGMLHLTRSRFSGIDKKVIESLPLFRFLSLRGSKQGLECAVCLSKFEDVEIVRLLPKCKHGFHFDCIDKWLEKHSSCPLCRQKVNTEDLTMFTYTNSMRFSRNQSLREDSNIELYVQREQDNGHGSSRFSIGSSFRKTEDRYIENQVLIQEEESDNDDEDRGKIFHKFNHRIIVSDVVMKNRWSSVSSSDLMFLNAEMLNDMSSNRFSSIETDEYGQFPKPIGNDEISKIKKELEIKRLFENKFNKSNPICEPSTSTHATSRVVVNQGEKRSMSEITALSRFRDVVSTRNGTCRSSLSENYTKEGRTRRVWLPIATRTIQWFANKEKRRSQQSQHLDV